MGDRANVKVVDGDSTVFLYTHWAGTELPITLQKALSRGRDRWTDGQYLSRIIFCEMVGNRTSELTGFGISSVCGDGDDRILTVDVGKQEITYNGKRGVSFDSYVAASYKPDWENGILPRS